MLASLAPLSACGESSGAANAPNADDAPSTAAAEETTEETEPEYPHLDTSAIDFGGKKLTFISPEWGSHKYMFTDELDGEAVNDAAYHRMSNTENALNINIEYVWSTDSECHNVVKKSVQAGDDAYQIVYTHCIYGISDYATAGVLYNLYDLPYVD